jgi:hypothetical protein
MIPLDVIELVKNKPAEATLILLSILIASINESVRDGEQPVSADDEQVVEGLWGFIYDSLDKIKLESQPINEGEIN